MSRARSAVAVKATIEDLGAFIGEAFGVEVVEKATFDDFSEAVQFCHPHVEDFGADAGHNAWYIWRVGAWAILGDLDLKLPHEDEGLAALSKKYGEAVAVAIDETFGLAVFTLYEKGKLRRRVELNEGEISFDGRPISAEVGHRVENFDEMEADRIWQTYGLPTFEYEPEVGPFVAVHVQA